MDELKKLEEVQRMLTFMESRGLASSTDNTNRFIANLFLLLIQPCGDLDMKQKCSLIIEEIPRISIALLEEASLVFNPQPPIQQTEHKVPVQQSRVGDGFLVSSDRVSDDGLVIRNFEDMAVIGLDAMQRANSTLEDFCRSYFMFHEMDINKPQWIFKYLPVLSFAESFIYQMDILNERIVNMSIDGVGVLQKGYNVVILTILEILLNPCDCFLNFVVVNAIPFETQEANECWIAKFIDLLQFDPFRPLVGQLECLGLLTERYNLYYCLVKEIRRTLQSEFSYFLLHYGLRIMEEFRCGEEYWALERKLCAALINQNEIYVEDVMRAVHLKSFDYRLLNLLLYQLRGEKAKRFFFEAILKVNDLHMEFLSISEFLVEVADDLFDYEDDVLENNFNILRMFVRIYGPSAAPVILAKYIAEAEEKYDHLLKTLDPQLSLNYQRRCEEATKEGGKTSGHPLGTWSMPHVIVDEELYRSNCLHSK